MADHADGPVRDESSGAPAPAPFVHTWWQHTIRELFLTFGPAQTGLPPFPTPQEREDWRRANAPLPPPPPRENQVPPGYRIVVYTDENGLHRRSLVPSRAGVTRNAVPEETTEQTRESA
jgi:hypothetical protein